MHIAHVNQTLYSVLSERDEWIRAPCWSNAGAAKLLHFTTARVCKSNWCVVEVDSCMWEQIGDSSLIHVLRLKRIDIKDLKNRFQNQKEKTDNDLFLLTSDFVLK